MQKIIPIVLILFSFSSEIYSQTKILPKDVEVRMGQNRKSQKPTCQDSLNQEKTTSKIGLKYTTEWEEINSVDGIVVFYKYADCNPSIGYDKEMILLKFINTESKIKKIDWHSIQEYGGKCITCDYPEEYTFNVVLKPNQTIEGTCDLDCPASLRVFSKFTDKQYKGSASLLSNFEMKNIKVIQK